MKSCGLGSMEKRKRLLIAEIIICIAIFLAILLPNVCGTTTQNDISGDIEGVFTLDGMTAAVINSDVADKTVHNKYPQSKVVEYTDVDEVANALDKENADFFVCSFEEAILLRDKYEELYILPGALIVDGVENFVVIKKERYKYGTTNKTFKDVENAGATIACMSGTDDQIHLEERFHDCQFKYYPALPDILQAVSIGAVDYGSAFDNTREEQLAQFEDIAALPENCYVNKFSFMFPRNDKGNKLCKEFNDFYKKCRESGVYDEMLAKWQSQDESKYVIDVDSYKPDVDNGQISVVTLGKWTPMSFIYNNELSGMYVELTYMFCKEYGYTPQFSIADIDGELAGVATGEYDMVADIASENEERKKNVIFSDTILEEATILVTKADTDAIKEVPKAQAFVQSIKESFVNCFITQKRYQMLFDGLNVTITISLLSILLGTVLGGIICALRMSGNTFCEAFSIIYIKLVQGMPIVVLLLLLFYVVFAGTGIDSRWICVVGFSLDFSAYCSEIFRTNIESVPRGQRIAARALGFSEVGAFTRVVLPQALIGILPVYCGQVVSLIKLTSVAGYIAVVDLTKSSDLIRSATYEALFPLLVTALVYFILASVINLLLRIVGKHYGPRLKPSR